MEHYDGEARGNLEVGEGELDDEGLEEAVEDEKCNRISDEGEADEQSVVGSKVFLEGNTEESKMSVFSKDSEDSETSLSWGDSPDVEEDYGDENSIHMQSLSDNERGGSMLVEIDKPLDKKRATGHESILKCDLADYLWMLLVADSWLG